MGNCIIKSPGGRNPLAHQRCEDIQEVTREETITESVSIITCEICVESVFSNKLFKNQNKCAHPYCLDCITKYIDAKVDDRMSRIMCPALNCDNYFDPLSCRPFISSQVFNKWCDVLCESAVLEIDRCYCPYGDCSVMILNECGGRVKKSKCPKCNKLFCFSCHAAWHAGYRCEEARELRDTNDIAFGVLVENKKWQRCPACHHCVERSDGCSIVQCRCGTSFCYKCGNKVEAHWCGCSIDGHEFIFGNVLGVILDVILVILGANLVILSVILGVLLLILGVILVILGVILGVILDVILVILGAILVILSVILGVILVILGVILVILVVTLIFSFPILLGYIGYKLGSMMLAGRLS